MDSKIVTFFDMDSEIDIALTDLGRTVVVIIREPILPGSGEIAMYIQDIKDVKRLHKNLGRRIKELENKRKENNV